MKLRNRIRIRFAWVLALGIVSGILAYPSLLRFIPSIGQSASEALPINLGLDLQGGIHLEYAADLSQIEGGKSDEALQAAVDVIERRVNAFGVGEAVIQTAKSGTDDRIIVELPGVRDIDEAKSMIKETPFLEFREDASADFEESFRTDNEAARKQAEDALALARKGDDFAELAKRYSEDPGSSENGGDIGSFKRGMLVPEYDEVIFKDDFKTGDVYPELVESTYGWHIIKKTEVAGEGENLEVRSSHILFVKQSLEMLADPERFKATGLSGRNLTDAFVDYEGQGFGKPQVGLKFDSEGGELFAELTKRNIGKPLAIFLDGAVISAPTIQAEITGGQAVITGDFTLEEVKDYVRRLNEGALPVPIELVSQQTVDASLGKDVLVKSIYAGVMGLIAVSVYMLLYYRFLGFGAVFALLIYSAMLLALFRLSAFSPFPITLTLSGIAGFILSIGIAVDANVLIFERTREELAYGKTVVKALEEGFRRAWPSIRDGHVSTLITTFILILMGTGFVKGFAVILSLGVLLSLFTAVVLVRSFLRFSVGEWAEKHPAWLVAPKKAFETETR